MKIKSPPLTMGFYTNLETKLDYFFFFFFVFFLCAAQDLHIFTSSVFATS